MTLAVATFASTVLGGLFALRFRDRAHLILGFMAGFLLGIVGFEIFPEIVSQLSASKTAPTGVMTAFVGSFLAFHVLEKLIVLHHSHEEEYAAHRHPHVGMLAAMAFVGHSFLDGVGIGLGFRVSAAVGVAVAAAVISHDFTDGMNTVSVLLANRSTTGSATLWLLADAAAPIAGLASTFAFRFPPGLLLLYLGAFAGTFLYIGAADILPEAHSEHPSALTIAMTVAGAAAAFALSRAV